jgi:hypothetical protein
MEEPTIPHYHYYRCLQTELIISPCIGKSKSSLLNHKVHLQFLHA